MKTPQEKRRGVNLDYFIIQSFERKRKVHKSKKFMKKSDKNQRILNNLKIPHVFGV